MVSHWGEPSRFLWKTIMLHHDIDETERDTEHGFQEIGMISVCYILSYHDPNYNRTRTLVRALQKLDDIQIYQARNSSKGIWRYFETLWKLIAIRASQKIDFYILGFRGYELFWPVRIITFGKPLIYDHMMSPYDSLLNERKWIKEGSFIEKFVYLYEKSVIDNSDIILTDTDIHKKYFDELFKVNSQKILEIPVGADEELFHIHNTHNLDKPVTFEILFYGTFLPLHGIDVILGAASRLRDYQIHFTLIGNNKSKRYHQMIKQASLGNVTYTEWIAFEHLPQLIAQADLGLGGPFGNTGQAHRVITGKTFQFLAMAKPVVVGELAGNYGFEDKVNCLVVPQGNEKALAETIYWAFRHKTDIEQIGRQGYELYQSRYSIKEISEKLKKVFYL
jgi:glycosyltransferase involved in cell wall biosynthesis